MRDILLRPRRDNSRGDETALDGTGGGAEFWRELDGQSGAIAGTADLQCSMVRKEYIGPIER